MTTTNTSAAPAFPTTGSDPIDGPGINIRQYFAARAPHIVAGWFQPLMPARPTPPDQQALLKDLPAPVVEYAERWRRDPDWDLADVLPDDPHLAALVSANPGALAAYQTAWHRYHEETASWTRTVEQERVAQWPWAWADLVLGAEANQP